MTCPHLRRALFRVVGRDGRLLVAEQCLDCGENARGRGVWVPRGQVGRPAAELPLLADYSRGPASGPEQRDLFE